MNLESIFTPQVKLFFDFLVFFLAAPEIMGERALRNIRKFLIVFLFWASIISLAAIILLFLYFWASVPEWLSNFAVQVAFTITYTTMDSGASALETSIRTVLVILIFWLIFLAASFIPALLSHLLTALADKKDLRRLLIKIGVILFVVSKALELALTLKTG